MLHLTDGREKIFMNQEEENVRGKSEEATILFFFFPPTIDVFLN